MSRIAAELVPASEVAAAAVFALVAVIAAVRGRRGGPAQPWAPAAFGILALFLGALELEEALRLKPPGWLYTLQVVMLLLFPYLLLRFTARFRRLSPALEVAAAVLVTAVVTASVLVLPQLRRGAPSASTGAFLVGVLVYWLLVSLVTVAGLWRAGRDQPTVARRRMRLMSIATVLVTVAVALVVVSQGGETAPGIALTVHLVALLSGAAFGVGYHPPRALRLSWRLPEEERVQRSTMAVLRATTVQQVAAELLPPTVRLLGGRGAALIDADRTVVASFGDVPPPGTVLSEQGDDREVVALQAGRCRELIVWTGPYAPFFASEEIRLLQTMGAVASLALERCELLAEERAQRAASELAQRETERARAQAHRANMAKSEFLSRMSHELHTPLNAVLGFGQLLEVAPLEPDDRDSVAQILRAGRHLLALIDDVLDLSRIETGNMALALEPVEAGGLIREAVDMIVLEAERRSIGVTVAADECHVHVETDRRRCRQALLNLLSNAVKYNRDGGTVVVRCERVAERTLRIVVRDDGPGVEASRLHRLFEPFDRLGAEGSAVRGTGLGLALTKQLVERLGGAIGVETAVDEGSTFWIDLPVSDADAQPGAATTEDGSGRARPSEALVR